MSSMAQKSLFLCRKCQGLVSGTSQRLATRAFATTAAQSKSKYDSLSSPVPHTDMFHLAIPTFTESPSEELNAILLDFREKVFTPAAFNKTHTQLVYKKSRHHILRNDPGVVVTLGNGEEIKLEPMDRWDRPNKRKSLFQIGRIFGQENDITVWENLPSFLKGLILAKEKIPVAFLEKITRKANETGRAGLIRKCAELADQTGVKLSIRPITRELFLGIHSNMARANFTGEELEKASSAAENLTLLMEQKQHCAGPLALGQVDMRRDAVVMAVLLELHAAKALSLQAGNDTDGKVTAFAERLVALSQEQAGILQRDQKPNACQAVEDWIPLANGLRLALRVSGLSMGSNDAETRLKMSLKSLLDQVDEAIAEEVKVIKDEAKDKPRRALKMLEQIKQ